MADKKPLRGEVSLFEALRLAGAHHAAEWRARYERRVVMLRRALAMNPPCAAVVANACDLVIEAAAKAYGVRPVRALVEAAMKRKRNCRRGKGGGR